MMNHEFFMKLAIKEAIKADGKVSPNPLVGAVIVKNDNIISTGYHHKAGTDHAEIDALRKMNFHAENCILYVTLEPCCFYGKTPPCTSAIIRSKVSTLVYGTKDPNPRVAGDGLKQLSEAGIKVIGPILENDCDNLIEIFRHFIITKKPFIAVKTALSLDGKIATHSGDSKWISNEKSRTYVQKLRNKYSAILCGINTVIHDNPRLNCRMKNGKNPVKIIFDPNFRITENATVFSSSEKPVYIIIRSDLCLDNKQLEKKEKILSLNSKIFPIDYDSSSGFNISEFLSKMGKADITSILVEGGQKVFSSFINDNKVNKFYFFTAPILLGDQSLDVFSTSQNIETIQDGIRLQKVETKLFDNDILNVYVR